MKGFTEAETELLIKEALRAADNGESLTSVFTRVASLTGRAQGSVRNYYYGLIKDEARRKKLSDTCGDISRLKACRAKEFSKEEETFLMQSVLKGKERGKSVRKTIMEITGGDDHLYLRYQNKYRNILKKQDNERIKNIDINKEDFYYFTKLSREIDGLVEKIKDKYAAECVKLKRENERLESEINMLKAMKPAIPIMPFYVDNGKKTS